MSSSLSFLFFSLFFSIIYFCVLVIVFIYLLQEWQTHEMIITLGNWWIMIEWLWHWQFDELSHHRIVPHEGHFLPMATQIYLLIGIVRDRSLFLDEDRCVMFIEISRTRHTLQPIYKHHTSIKHRWRRTIMGCKKLVIFKWVSSEGRPIESCYPYMRKPERKQFDLFIEMVDNQKAMDGPCGSQYFHVSDSFQQEHA